MENDEVKAGGEDYELGTFEFLKTGWWILHVVAIVGVFYLGYLFGGSLFK
jgi:nitrate reductase NapE component